MGSIKKTNAGPPTFGGGRFPVEQDLGNKDNSMTGPTIPPAMIPEFSTSRFGHNLVENDKNEHYNPKGPPSPGVPTHQDNVRFGGSAELPDKTPAYNPQWS